MEKYKTIDLFSGLGGIRRGYELTGRFNNVLSADVDRYACKVYKHLYNEDSFNDVTSEEFKNKVESTEYDVLLGGFPCQSFSIAGLQKGFADETSGTLFFDIADIIKRTRPKSFMLENVEGLLKHEKGRTFQTIIKVLNELGYKVVSADIENGEVKYNGKNFVRSTKDFGIPQKRARIFIMGFRKDIIPKNYMFPNLPNHSNIKVYNNLYDLLETKVDSKYYLSDRLLTTLKNHRSSHASVNSGFGYIVVNEGENPVSNTIMATGGSGKERNLIRQPIKEYEGLLVGRGNEINKEGIRNMTPTEWGKLQGFINYGFIENMVDTFSFPEGISDTQQYKLFGNSVSIPVIKAMAEYMIERLDDFYGNE
ncbi:MAG: DNA (cytosine-5-)-methyltransferase [Bacilli bacterium]